MINKDFFAALEDLQREKGIDKENIIKALEQALTSACKKSFNEATNVLVKLLPEKNTIRIFSYKKIVDEVVDKDKEISIDEARLLKKSYKLGDNHYVEIFPKDFGRIAAQTAKQVVIQAVREAERSMTFNHFADRENQMITGIVRRIKEDGTIYVEIGKNQMEGVLNTADQSPGEKFREGDKIRVFVKKVKDGPKSVQIILSRNAVGLVRCLMELEVPEIRSGLVEIKSLVREAGYRTKMAVFSNDRDIDAVGACVGNKGVRVNSIVSELFGEKIDIIYWCEDVLDYIARALSPAKVLMAIANQEMMEAKVIVPDDKLSLAIGKNGMNARLAARLTGWKIDVKSYSDALSSGLLDMNSTEDIYGNQIENDVFDAEEFKKSMYFQEPKKAEIEDIDISAEFNDDFVGSLVSDDEE